MQLIEKYKAIILTVLICGSVFFGVFSIQLSNTKDTIAETFYEVEAKTEEELQAELKETEDLKSPTTNKAVNEDAEYKALMKNFKTVSYDDFEKTTKKIEENRSEIKTESASSISINSNKAYALKQKETEAYKSLQGLLDKKSKSGIVEHASGGSTLTYSLKGRNLLSYNTPRYLCETSGKIVVNIKVDNQGNVFEVYINGASNSNNKCLTEHAIIYAKSVRFDNAKRTDQLGSITFYFKGKN